MPALQSCVARQNHRWIVISHNGPARRLPAWMTPGMSSANPSITAQPASAIEIAHLRICTAQFHAQLEPGKAVVEPPQITVTAGFAQQPLQDGFFTAMLELRVVGVAGAEPLFTAAAAQGAVLKAAGMAADAAAALVAREAPGLVYPYARLALEDLFEGSQFIGFRLGLSCPPLSFVPRLDAMPQAADAGSGPGSAGSLADA